MDLGRPRTLPDNARFPRRRGDGPPKRPFTVASRMFPPQARGWTPLHEQERRRFHVSPAGAGMDLRHGPPMCGGGGFPRRRGDGPIEELDAGYPGSFPPQARGWTSRIQVRQRMHFVSPAGAGMDRCQRRGTSRSSSFPRRRGDGPFSLERVTLRQRFPPQARGWTLAIYRNEEEKEVSPAGAGMDRSPISGRRWSGGFPRRRGDGPFSPKNRRLLIQFPPQARGWTAGPILRDQPGAVSPAGAGMDPWSSPYWTRSRRFPRRRGDGPRFTNQSTASSWFPRRRGDGPVPKKATATISKFPPQARGWTRHREPEREWGRVSPAGAGMDR